MATHSSVLAWRIPGTGEPAGLLSLGLHMDCRLPGSSVHGISQVRILEWVASYSSKGSSQPKDGTHVSCISCTAGRFFTTEPPGRPLNFKNIMMDPACRCSAVALPGAP